MQTSAVEIPSSRAASAEARRRRILARGTDRLDLITGSVGGTAEVTGKLFL